MKRGTSPAADVLRDDFQRFHAVMAALGAVVTVGLLVVALANTSTALDPSPALVGFLAAAADARGCTRRASIRERRP